MDEFVRQAARLATNYISARSVAIVIRDRAGNTATGTSTCIKMGAHFLLATAGHVIEDVNDDRIQLIPAGELSSAPLPFVARSCSPRNPAPASDVAWIELDQRVVSENRLRLLASSDLRPGQLATDRDHPFLVHGYPHQRAILTATSSDVESTVAYTMMANETDLHRPVEDYEIATEYPPRDAQDQPIQVAPEAHGLSGGGVWWHPRCEEAALTSPTHMKLVAVNTKWHQPTAILFSTRIDEWLDLVARDFPEVATGTSLSSAPGSTRGGVA